jgi:hypothetical protein
MTPVLFILGACAGLFLRGAGRAPLPARLRGQLRRRDAGGAAGRRQLSRFHHEVPVRLRRLVPAAGAADAGRAGGLVGWSSCKRAAATRSSIAFVVAAVLTPPDVISQLLLAIPLTKPATASALRRATRRSPSAPRPAIATIDTIGDQDFFKVELEAGKTYDIGQYARTGGPSGVPLADAYIELYDATGKLIVSADGGGPNTPSGSRRAAHLHREATGTYYINARAYDNDAGRRHDRRSSATTSCSCATPIPTAEPTSPITTSTARSTRSTGAARSTAPSATRTAEGPRVTGNATPDQGRDRRLFRPVDRGQERHQDLLRQGRRRLHAGGSDQPGPPARDRRGRRQGLRDHA